MEESGSQSSSASEIPTSAPEASSTPLHLQSDLCTSSVDELLDFLLESPLLDPTVRVAHFGPRWEIEPETLENVRHDHTSMCQKRTQDENNLWDTRGQSKFSKLSETLSSEVDQTLKFAPIVSNGGSKAKVKVIGFDIDFDIDTCCYISTTSNLTDSLPQCLNMCTDEHIQLSQAQVKEQPVPQACLPPGPFAGPLSHETIWGSSEVLFVNRSKVGRIFVSVFKIHFT